jgi:uncharacterized protein YbjT (DUF2867 family)
LPKLDVLVVGSTGQQGGAVARSLLQGGHRVRALTRNLAHPAADVLRLRGARLAWTDLADEKRLEDVARGADAIFAVTTTRDGPEAETRYGLAIAELARRLDVKHLVYSSAAPASERTGVPHFDSKHEIEQYLQAVRVPYTVVCASFFMDNLLGGAWLEGLRRGVLPLPLSPGRKLQQTAKSDLGRFVRVVLEGGAAFHGQRICIASDELTPIETAATLARIIGLPLQPGPREDPRLRAVHPDMAALIEWAEAHDGIADVAGLRRRYGEVNWHTLDGWAMRQDWTVIAPGGRR